MKRGDSTTTGSGAGGGSGSNNAQNKATPRRNNGPGVVSGESVQPSQPIPSGCQSRDSGRSAAAANRSSPCCPAKVAGGGGKRLAAETKSAGGFSDAVERGAIIKVDKARGPTLEDALDDVQVRFVLNLPEAELSSADRLFMQLEQAWWFYEDFIADAHTHLPHYRLKEFAKLMFSHCEALRPLSGKYNELFEYFRSWKGTIPTAGCILLNADMTKLVLVKSWKGNSRGFPKGKINQGEPALAAAIREVWEETGYDASGKANEEDSLSLYVDGLQTKMFLVTAVDEDYPFEPQVRKEVSAVEWYPLDALPKGTYGVEPFMLRLGRWMAKKRGMPAPKEATPEARTQSTLRLRKISQEARLAANAPSGLNQPRTDAPEGEYEGDGDAPADATKRPPRKGKAAGAAGGSIGGKDGGAFEKGIGYRARSAPNRRAKGYDALNRDTFGSQEPASGTGRGEGWGFNEMMDTNERITGRTFVYDGNPHEFGETAQALAPSGPTAPPAPVLPAAQAAMSGPVCSPVPASGVAHAAVPVVPTGYVNGTLQGDRYVEAVEVRGVSRMYLGNGGAGVPVEGVMGVGRFAVDSDDTEGFGMNGVGAETEGLRYQGDAPCTERMNADVRLGESGGERDCGSARWANAAAAPSVVSEEGGGLFGDFKFDLRDIMSAVPRS